MYDVISFGSITVDVFLGTEAAERHGMIEYPAGTKILVKDVHFETGGCGMNVAIGLKRLGCNSALLGKVGSDENGRMVLGELGKERVDFVGPPGKGKTGYSVILDSVTHERTILEYKGANNELKPSEISKSKLNAKWFYFSSELEDSFITQNTLADFARKHGIRIAYNPGIRDCVLGQKRMSKILKASEILILNAEEAAALSGLSGKSMTNSISMLKCLRRMGPGIVCITDGDRDAFFSDGRIVYRMTPNKTRVVERTGAGDAFASGMLAGIIRGKSLEYSLQLGLANAESVIKYVGARNKLLGWKEAEAIIKRRPAKIMLPPRGNSLVS